MTASLLICARAVHFSSGMILVAVVAFRWVVLLPALAGETDAVWESFVPLFRRFQRLFIWSGLAMVLSGLALFWAVTAGMSGLSLIESLRLENLSTVFFQTRFGQVTQWRVGLAVALGLLMALLTQSAWQTRRTISVLEMAAGCAAIALLVSLAWTGHAAATGGADFCWRIAADVLHLFAAAIWPGGLLPFALFLSHAGRLKSALHRASLLAVVRRFSTSSLVTVVVLVATGLINGFYLVGSFAALLQTAYGQVLCVKLFLFTLILGFAAWNRFHLLPLLFASAHAEGDLVAPMQSLRNFVRAELALAVAVLGVVSLLGTMPPVR